MWCLPIRFEARRDGHQLNPGQRTFLKDCFETQYGQTVASCWKNSQVRFDPPYVMIPAGLLLVLMGACCYAQYYPFGYFGYRPFLGGYFPQRDEPHSLFRSGSADLLAVDSPSPSFDSKLEVASRAWAIFTTITFTVSFSTTTATITTYTICTTSTSFVSTWYRIAYLF